MGSWEIFAIRLLEEFVEALTHAMALETKQVIWSPLFKLFLVKDAPVSANMPLIFQV